MHTSAVHFAFEHICIVAAIKANINQYQLVKFVTNVVIFCPAYAVNPKCERLHIIFFGERTCCS